MHILFGVSIDTGDDDADANENIVDGADDDAFDDGANDDTDNDAIDINSETGDGDGAADADSNANKISVGFISGDAGDDTCGNIDDGADDDADNDTNFEIDNGGGSKLLATLLLFSRICETVISSLLPFFSFDDVFFDNSSCSFSGSSFRSNDSFDGDNDNESGVGASVNNDSVDG